MRFTCQLSFLVFHIGEDLIHICRVKRMDIILCLHRMCVVFCIDNQDTIPSREHDVALHYGEKGANAIIQRPRDAVQVEIARRSAGQKSPKSEYPFTGKILCEKCGKNYRRKTTAAGIRWCCSTFNTYGREYCDAQMIPESVLEGIVGDREFKRISVPCAGTIRVEWADGTESEHHWQNPSRSKSWTEEMRQRASERSKEWHKSQSQ